jgi:hypothetical protein
MRLSVALLGLLFFIIEGASAFFLYADEGMSGLTGRWGNKDDLTAFRDNPALLTGEILAGGYYAQKYGFKELELIGAGCQGRWEKLHWGLFIRQFQKKPLQEKEALFALSAPLGGDWRFGAALKYLRGVKMGETDSALSWDMGFSWTNETFGIHAGILNGEHPEIGEEITHTLTGGGVIRRGPFQAYLKGVSIEGRYAYVIPALFYMFSPDCTIGYALNTGNSEHRCVLIVQQKKAALTFTYVIPPLLKRYVSVEVSVLQ